MKRLLAPEDDGSWNPWEHPTAWQSLRIALIGAVVCGLGFLALLRWGVGQHLTACGFDSNGVYAKVRVNNLLWGPDGEHVFVDFSIAGAPDRYQEGTVHVQKPAHGSITAVVHERFPPPRIPTENGPDLVVAGRTVYAFRPSHHVGRFVSQRFAEAHPRRTEAEVIPDDPSTLRCTLRGW
jgi:hypothetical protein